jgi:ABC-2 type transport system ATP-binding protein
MIAVEHLQKSYGPVEAVRDISFEVERGAVVGFLGPNGAGKSTTLRILAGFLGASAGSVKIAGHDIVEERLQAIQNLGYMPETSPLYPEMRVREYLGFRAELKRVRKSKRGSDVDRVLADASVTDMAERLIGELSKGYRQRVGLADVLLGSPPLLILDEPTAGLDPNQIGEVRKLIARLAEKHTILLSTHILSEVEATCDRAIVIDKGQLVAEGSIDELRSQQSSEEIALEVGGDANKAMALLKKVEGVNGVRRNPSSGSDLSLMVRFDDDVEPGAVTEQMVFALAAAKIGVRRLEPVAASLEEVFQQLTRGDEA